MLHWTFFFDGCQDKINKFLNQLVILVFASVQPLLSACLGFPQDRPSGLLPLLLSLLLCGALCRKLYNWVVSHQLARRGHGLGHTSVTRGREGGQGGGGVEGIRRGRTMVALCYTAPSTLCATCSEGWCHSARSSTPWIGQDFVSNSQRSQRASVQCLCKMRSNIKLTSLLSGISSNSGRQHYIRTKWSEKGEVRKVSCWGGGGWPIVTVSDRWAACPVHLFDCRALTSARTVYTRAHERTLTSAVTLCT